MGAAPHSRPARQVGGCPHVRFLVKLAKEHSAGARTAYERWWHSVGVTIRKLDSGLAGTPMAGTGAILERYGRRHHISPFFMAAAAGTESSFGFAACSNNHYNVWGLSSCGSGWYVPSFSSWEEAIDFYARFLRSHWPGAQTPYDFQGYAACSSCWGAKTSSYMRQLGASPTVRYP